jgi:hypothetical protein
VEAKEGAKSIEVEPGCFPPDGIFPPLISKDVVLGHNEDYISWLKGKGLEFAWDGRCDFSFDIVCLARTEYLSFAESRIEEMKQFSQNLREKGGFFFFRESDMQGGNKIWNGSDVFITPDGSLRPFGDDDRPDRFPIPNTPFSKSSTCYTGELKKWEIKAPFRRLW